MSGTPHGPKPRSLRRRLLLRVSLATLVIYVLAAALSYRQARQEVQELMDGQMTKTARLLLVQANSSAQHLGSLGESMAALRGVKSRRNEMALEFSLVNRDGAVLSRSKHAPEAPVNGHLGYATIEQRGRPWRTLTLETGDGQYRVRVSQSISQRNKEALEIATKTVLPLAVLLPLLIVLTYFSVRRGLKPLDELASDVSSRSPENLTRLMPSTALQETQPLVLALNQLLDRLATALENERRFTADAAHELRTPLAALRIQAQVAMATTDPAQCRDAVAKVIAGVDRATRLVEQLLRLARLDPLVSLPEQAPIDLGLLARTVCEDTRNIADRNRIDLRNEAPASPLLVSGDHDLLAAALRNLVDNALRYTPAGGTVCVRAGSEHGEPMLEVRDSGPGVPAEEIPRLVERFYRGREVTVTAEGCGLGLTIVRRIAELHGARLDVENLAGGGFVARLYWSREERSLV